MKILLFNLLLISMLSAQEFQVNTNVKSDQHYPKVCTLNNGRFVIVWKNQNQDISKRSIHAQVFNPNCEPLGGEFRVDTETPTQRNQGNPYIISMVNGDFIVFWESMRDNIRTYGRRFTSDGIAVTDEFPLNQTKGGDQYYVCASPLLNGDYVVVWRYDDNAFKGIWTQHFNAQGNPVTPEICVQDWTHEFPEYLGITVLTSGDYVICWRARGVINKFDRDIFARRYTSEGYPLGETFRVNRQSNRDIDNPDITSLPNNEFIVVWSNDYGNNKVYCRHYNSKGEPYGDEFCLISETGWSRTAPKITSLTSGGFAISWITNRWESYGDIGLRIYNSSFEPVYEDFRANFYFNSSQREPAISPLSDGGFVVCWESYYQDGDGWGIYAQKYPAQPTHHALTPFEPTGPTFDETVDTITPYVNWSTASSQRIAYPFELDYSVYYDTLATFETAQKITCGPQTRTILPALIRGKTWFWKVLVKNYNGDSLWSDMSAFHVSHTASDDVNQKMALLPEKFELSNHPNPFNPSTNIQFELPTDGFVTIRIYNLTGRLVRTLVSEQKLAGLHAIQWNGTDDTGQKVAAGVYLYQIEFTNADGEMMTLTKKMSLVK